MPVAQGAQRAHTSSVRILAMLVIAAIFAVGQLAINPSPTLAAGKKVVIIVGPTGSQTASFITDAKRYASVARGYGASVTQIYSPYATWSKVKAAAQGANILIYLGHGNGYPSPYGAFQRYTKDGFGLNKTSGNGHNNVQYWGEYYIDRDIQMAKNAVVILARLCYASGNSEWGAANPTRSTAIKRIDNYGAGFLRAGARAVFAEGITDAGYIIKNLYTSSRNMREIFFASPSRTMSYRFHFSSARTSGVTGSGDPYRPSRYYRSVVGWLATTANQWRAS
ncbi:MAG TPA: hypothetical protein VLA44_02280 [Clostridia bacterium]|nr:hypothetical protein [Clostridia bacterium]